MAKKKASLKNVAAPMAEPANNQTTTSDGKDATQEETRETVPRDPFSIKTESLKLDTVARDPSPDKTERLEQETVPKDPSPDKSERLKQLNEILLKQTMEKREQVSQLESQIDEMGVEFSLASETERDIMKAMFSAFVVNLSIETNEKLRETEAEKMEEVERGRALEAMVEYLKEVEQDEVKKRTLVEEEKAAILTQINGKEKEVLDLGKMVEDLEMVNSEMERRFLKVSEEKEALVREGIEKERLIGNLRTEKKEVETNLDECKKLVEKLEIKVEEEVKDKELKMGLLKNEKEALEAKIVSLEQDNALEVCRHSSEVEGLKQENVEKEGEIRDLNARIDGKHEKIVGLEKEIDVLQLAITDARKKGGFWIWIYPAATTILAAISFIYARAR